MTTDSTHEARIMPGEASARAALSHYADTFCEGWCEGNAEFAKFKDCSGCLAKRTLAATPSAPPADLEAESRELLAEARHFMLRHTDRGVGSGLQYSTAHMAKVERLNTLVAKIDRALSARQIAPPSEEAAAIVERLRAAQPHCNHHANAGLCHEAAALITRLSGGEVERLREALEGFCLSAECAAGCDEGVSQDDAYSEILSFAGSALATAYADARTTLQGESRD